MRLGRSELVVTRPLSPATDPRSEPLLAARAALRRALAMRYDVEVQIDQLRALVARLELEARQ